MLLGLSAGLLIGCVGVGGVIVVPALVYLFGVPIRAAVAAAMFAFLLSGVLGTFAYARKDSIRWRPAAWLSCGAMPAAFFGALAASVAPPRLIEAAVGCLAAASSLRLLFAGRGPESSAHCRISGPALGAAGAATGFLSALTGTGGPLVLVPVLAWLELPMLAALGLAQTIQLPIAALATAGNIVSGTLEIALGAALGVGVGIGTWAGARIAHAAPRDLLQRSVAAVLGAVGIAMLVRVLLVR